MRKIKDIQSNHAHLLFALNTYHLSFFIARTHKTEGEGGSVKEEN